MRRFLYPACAVLLCISVFPDRMLEAAAPDAPAARKYQSAEEAYRAGVGFVYAKELASGQKALEEALQHAPDENLKLKIYRALAGAGRAHPEIDTTVAALEFVIANSDSTAERSLMRSSLLSFVHQRGKENVIASRYEDRLKNAPDDKTALYILSELYDRWSPNARRGAEINERLLAIHNKEDGKIDAATAAQLAQQYIRSGKFKEGAELFEKVAPLDAKLSAWNLKEAAQAWLKAKDNEKAVIAAKASLASKAEKRSELLTYFWHKGLADVFLQAGEPGLAIEQYEKAIEFTSIEGYRRACLAKLGEARERAKQQDGK